MTNVIDYRDACLNNEGRDEAIERCLADIAEGKIVHVHSGGWDRDGLSLGDLSGFKEFDVTRPVYRAHSFGEKYWVINCTLMVSGKMMHEGDETQHNDIDQD
jgi:hypothetical protein